MTDTDKPNAALAYRVLDHIDAHPEQYDQKSWTEKTECGTVACFAGWVCLLSGDEPVEDGDGDIDVEVWADGYIERIPDRAIRLLGIPRDCDSGFGHLLFDSGNTREDLGRLVAEIFGPRPSAPVLKCHKCGSSLRDCVEADCVEAAQCGEVWCVEHMPDGEP